ncbi:MAG: SRPBCC family protein [Bacteroidaceae bacterium]|nr:SRPBCC family protein [Bacteroidaceae bacterium]
MTKYESNIKQVPHSQDVVYARLSDLRNLEVIRERMDDPMFVQAISSQVPADKLEKLRETVQYMEFTTDTVTVTNTPIGAVTLAIVEREEPKCIKFELQNAPMQGNLWVQLLPTSDCSCKMKCTIGIEANFFMRKMIEKPLKEGVEKLADMLSQIPYQ